MASWWAHKDSEIEVVFDEVIVELFGPDPDGNEIVPQKRETISRVAHDAVTTDKPDTDKRARVIAQSDLFAGGSVRFPRCADWLEDFTAELLAFPGRHDDQVDALTQGLAWGRNSRGEVSWGFVKGFY